MPPQNINWDAWAKKLPIGKNDAEKKARDSLFMQFDPNSNGYLSLAEVDKGCRDVLGLYELFEAKPVIMRAFQAAKGANDKYNKPGSHGPDYVERIEFRLLLVYLHKYFEIWQMFEKIDASDDRRVSIDEFTAALPLLAQWGVKVDDPVKAFKEVDEDGGGMILFNEFADWALQKHLDLPDHHFNDAAIDNNVGHTQAAGHHSVYHVDSHGKPADHHSLVQSDRDNTSKPAQSGDWMTSLAVDEETRAVLRKEKIDERAFKLLSPDDLKDLGFPLGVRKVLADEIAKRK